MALSEGLKSFVSFFMNGFNEEKFDEDALNFQDDNGLETDGALALKESIDQMYGGYGTNVTGNAITKPERSFGRESKLATLPNSYISAEVNVIEPRSFSEASQIVKKLIDKKTVVLHLDLLDREQSQRTIDFVCGASHALNGTAQKISDMVFIFTPSNVSLSMENGAVQNKFAESLWNKPL